jgi:colanic acid biosynthesis glycosyl transferase WcaI
MVRSGSPCRILVISQVYVPDPAAVGQYMADAAGELAKRGHDVRVLTSARGYADPTVKYPRRETLDGVEVIRLPLSSLGKRTILHRLVGHSMFLLQAIIRGWFTPRLAGILVSTSPPMASIAALAIRLIRRVPIKFWVMDLNPDQTVAMGAISPNNFAVKAFDWLNRRILDASSDVIVLDRFMGDRVNAKRDVTEKMSVIPPWPQEDELADVPRDENPFIGRHDLANKFVVMYSGNHGLTTPVDMLVEAALRLQDHPTLRFLFIGAGAGKKVVDETVAKHRPPNILSLPYQPLDQIKYSLSAADVHVVLMADQLVGLVHPCKVYGAMAIGKPVIYFGPRPSHITELLDQESIGWEGNLQSVDDTVALLTEIAQTPREQLRDMGLRARRLVDQRLSKEKLCGEFLNVVERGISRPGEQADSTVSKPRTQPVGAIGD